MLVRQQRRFSSATLHMVRQVRYERQAQGETGGMRRRDSAPDNLVGLLRGSLFFSTLDKVKAVTLRVTPPPRQ